jgi:hypothetical protein
LGGENMKFDDENQIDANDESIYDDDFEDEDEG